MIEFRFVILALSADTQEAIKDHWGTAAQDYVFSCVLSLSLFLFISLFVFLGGFQKYSRGWLWISTGKYQFPVNTLRSRSLPQSAPSLGAYQLVLLMIFSPPRIRSGLSFFNVFWVLF